MRRDTLNILHQGVGPRKDARIDALQNDALCSASPMEDDAICVVDMAAAVRRRSHKFAIDFKMPDNLGDIVRSGHGQSLLG
jgi:hypothetical protein